MSRASILTAFALVVAVPILGSTSRTEHSGDAATTATVTSVTREPDAPSPREAALDYLGEVDELVVDSRAGDGAAATSAIAGIDASALAVVEAAFADDQSVDGVMPIFEMNVPVLHEATGLAEPDVVLTGLDPARLSPFAGLVATDGARIDVGALSADGVVLSDRLANRLDAEPGDVITTVYNNLAFALSVEAIAANSYLSGERWSGINGSVVPGMVMPLERLQALTEQPDRLSAVAISNAAGVDDGPTTTDEVVATLQPVLAGRGLAVRPVKQELVAEADVLVAQAVVGSDGDAADAGWDVRADVDGANPTPDLAAALTSKGVDPRGFEAVGITRLSDAAGGVRVADDPGQTWKQHPVVGMDDDFLVGSDLRFGHRARGYETDTSVIEALRTEPNLAFVDASAVPRDGDPGGTFALIGLPVDDPEFDPITVELLDPLDGSIHPVTVIGVLDETVGSFFGLFAAQPTVEAIYGPKAGAISYYVALSDPERAEAVAKEIEAALRDKGVDSVPLHGDW